jgi:hypothetical protein
MVQTYHSWCSEQGIKPRSRWRLSSRRPGRSVEPLTSLEQEMLRLVAQEMTNRENRRSTSMAR